MEKGAEEILGNLMFLGMTRAQARVYVTLLTLGSATARQVADASGMNVAVTYRRIKELTGMNLLVVRLGTPNKYDAVVPDRGLKRLLERTEVDARYKRHLARELNSRLSAMIGERMNDAEDKSSSGKAYRLLTGRDRLFEESRRLRQQTKYELLLILPALGLRRLVRHGYVREVAECAKRGVDVRILTEITDSDVLESGQLASVTNLRHYPNISFRLGVYDREKMHIGAAYDDDLSTDGRGDVYLVISDAALASSMAVLFEAIWKMSSRPSPILSRLAGRASTYPYSTMNALS